MKFEDFFRYYSNSTEIEIFRGEDLPAELPNKNGLYAWYAKPSINYKVKGSGEKKVNTILEKDVFSRFQRQPYNATIKADLEPMFTGKLNHELNLNVVDERSEEESNQTLKDLFYFFQIAFAPFFSSPIYIGKAVKQTIRERVIQHISKLEECTKSHGGSYSASLDTNQYNYGLLKQKDEIELHSFALEAAKRGFFLSDLVLITFSPSNTADNNISIIENVLNRIIYPLCGRR